MSESNAKPAIPVKARFDHAILATALYRPNAKQGRNFAHVMLLRGIERGLPVEGSEELELYLGELRNDLEWTEPEGCRALAGERRSAAHMLALHAVGTFGMDALPIPTRRYFQGRSWRALQARTLKALDKGETHV